MSSGNRHWIDADQATCDRINAAVRAVQHAEDELTARPTWAHLAISAQKIREAADRLMDVIDEERP